MKTKSLSVQYEKSVLSNGLRVVTESHPHTRAVSVGVFVRTGSRHEPTPLAGITHFLEHLVFRGTKRRTGYEISKALDAVGGDLNAYTSREYTVFHAAALQEHLRIALDVALDLVTSARLTGKDTDIERSVILQELQMSRENLEEYIIDSFVTESYKGHELATPILGTEESLEGLRRTDILGHYRKHYVPENMIVSVAGSIDHDQVVEFVERFFKIRPGKAPQARSKKLNQRDSTRMVWGNRVVEFFPRPSEQAHVVVGIPSCPYISKLRFESYLLNDLIGGGATSRLYQNLRERKGLVYSVYSFLQSFVDSGQFMVYAATAPENVMSVLKSVKGELNRIQSRGMTRGELKRYKTQVEGQLLLGAEDLESRMNSLGVNEMVFGHYRPVEEVIDDVHGVTIGSVDDFLGKYFDKRKPSLMVIGDLEAKGALACLEYWDPS